MNRATLLPRLITGILLAAFFGLSLYLRIALPYDTVFVGDWIKFTGTDAYYHMMLVDNLANTLPAHSTFNPYMVYPGGSNAVLSFFDYLIAGIIWLVSLGSPTQHIIDVVGVYVPPVMGALTIIPVYFIGKTVFHRWAGVMAAGLIAIMPGETIGRSILGFTDHHVAEVLFTTTTIMFLALAVKSAVQGEFSFNRLRQKEPAVITKPLVYSLLTGIFLGIYLLTWPGALLFVFIIFVFFVIQFIIDHLRRNNTDYLCLVGVVSFVVATLIFLPFQPRTLYLASMFTALITPVLLYLVSRFMAVKGVKPIYYPLAIIGLGAIGVGLLYIISPTTLKTMLAQFNIFAPSGAYLTIMEAQPILTIGGKFTFTTVWGNFTTGFFLSFISLGVMIYYVVKRGEANKTLLVVWSLIILAATLGQRRFAYYLAVNVAVLTAYVSWLALRFVGFKERTMPEEATAKSEKIAKGKRKGSPQHASPVNMAIGLIAIIVLVFYPNIGPLPKIGPWPAGTKLAINVASNPQFAPSDAWQETLSWMRNNTPDPFNDPDFYYKRHQSPFTYPETAYGVTAWWDYGYWIARIGHRIPNSNPGQIAAGSVAKVFLAQDEAAGTQMIAEKNFQTKYVVIDYETVTSKFHALPQWAGYPGTQFYETYYYKQKNGQLASGYCFYPEYYRSLVARLYNFDGHAVVPASTTVISYEQKLSQEGITYKEITSARAFPSYEEAESYVSSQKSGNYRIISPDPFVSPVPLSELKNFKLVHSSSDSLKPSNREPIPKVKVFEYTER